MFSKQERNCEGLSTQLIKEKYGKYNGITKVIDMS